MSQENAPTAKRATSNTCNNPQKSSGQRPPDKNAATKTSREKKKSANRARHRLLSIRYDVEHYLKPLLLPQEGNHHQTFTLQNLPIVANERCGTWYTLPFSPHSFCHFKSTDGHVHLFSLKRLNLPFLRTVANANHNGSVVILDASNRKEMPDSFSRTLPLWACVLNRVAERYRLELGMELLFSEEDLRLFLPSWIIPDQESATMESIVDIRVEELYQSQAIVDVPSFVATLCKPLRPFWITPLHSDLPTDNDETRDRFYNIICCNASNLLLAGADGNNSKSRIVWREQDQFFYTPGAADDHESWARNLTPHLFWDHVHQFTPDLTDQETEDRIDGIVQKASSNEQSSTQESFDWIGNLNIAIGTRRAGRPPDCWGNFDAILNVTNTEYDEMLPSTFEEKHDKFYLQLPVEEGKRDKQQLERWLSVGIMFCVHHAIQNRRILIHCAQGRDRSVAVAMAVVQLFCTLRYPLQWNRAVLQKTVDEVISSKKVEEEATNETKRQRATGLPQHFLERMVGEGGRDVLLSVACNELGKAEGASLATKESLRVVLHLIRQDREKAEPARSTMQKLNRFFMSKAFEPVCGKEGLVKENS